MPDISALQTYSLGIVLTAKKRGDDYIEVMPIEKLTQEKGAVSGTSKTHKATLPNQHGVEKTSTVVGGAQLVAKWVARGQSNRETPPDVQPGETVEILSYADTNDYYWTTLMREPTLRRLETVRYLFSNQPSGRASYDEDTSYWFEVSTHDQSIKLHTSSNNGEPVTYDLLINTREGSIELKDDIGNSVKLDSVAGTLETTTNTSVTVNTQKYVVNASESIELNTPNYTLNGETSTINADSHTENAASTITNGLSVKGGEGPGSLAITGNVLVNGEISGTGTIHTDGEVHGSNIS